MFNHEFILKNLCISQETVCGLRKATPEKLLSPSLNSNGKYFLKDASFLETNKIIGLNVLHADLPLPVSSFIATGKSLFWGLIIPQDLVLLICI